MSFSNSLADVQMKTMNIVHRTIRTVSGGRLGNTLGSMPVVELHAVGRKSGKERLTMLTTPLVEDGTYVLVASKGGDDRDPEWYLNITANPDIRLVTADGESHELTARTATDDEKAELWPRIVDAYKGYAGYAEKTDRNIPVVLCEPRA
jgi:deazaflavin-dependent oxidoreductase (nitroreductase family)